MTTRTKVELKKIAHEALVSEYGFAPAMNNIILLEANGEGTYIRFMVKNHEYRFESTLSHGTVFCGNNTISKES